MKLKLPLCLLAIFLVTASTVPAVTIINEFTGGLTDDLSNDPLNPTMVNLDVGTNSFFGQVTTSNGDTRDYFTFIIGAGQSLTGMFLISYVDGSSGGAGDRGYIMIDDGAMSVIPTNGTSSDFLGGSHLDTGIFPSPATNVLTTLANAPQGGVGFTAPLGPGTYTVNVQQTGQELSNYQLDLEVVPEPTSVALLFGAAGIAGWYYRRRWS
ncbi:MAG: PEP-CTERM sorting domain-containing protein [Verrucomicrobiota bacterium]